MNARLTRLAAELVLLVILGVAVPTLFADNPCTYVENYSTYGTCQTSCPAYLSGQPCSTYNSSSTTCNASFVMVTFNPNGLAFACDQDVNANTKCTLSMNTDVCVQSNPCIWNQTYLTCNQNTNSLVSCKAAYENLEYCD
jgi:hypothetical protein